VSSLEGLLTHPFPRPHPANDVHVTGTFDDWGKTEKLEKVGDVFEKEVTLPSADEKYYYKVRAPSSGSVKGPSATQLAGRGGCAAFWARYWCTVTTVTQK
jgi:hypothetical protein